MGAWFGRLRWSRGSSLERLNRLTYRLALGVAIALFPSSARSYRLPAVSSTAPSPPKSAFLAHAELPLLLLDPAPLAPRFPTFNSQPLDLQIRLYSRYLMTHGTPDILIVGSSRALQGVDPVALQQGLEEQGYPNLRIYNFSINGATARVVDLMLQQILPLSPAPRVLIWADGSRAFNSAKTDVTYNGIITSVGYAQLRHGRRPIQALSTQVLPTPSSEICIEPPVVPTAQTSSLILALSRDLVAPSSSSQATSQLSAPACSRLWEPTAHLPARPLWSYSPSPIEQSSLVPIASNGFQFISAQFDPAPYYRQFPRVSGQYDDNYVPFRLTGEQTTATVAIATVAHRRRIPLIFVSLPLTRDYLDPVRQRYEQQFRQYIQQLATEQRFLFRDLSQRWPTQNEYFADPSHLNGQGARAVGAALASDGAIPWATLLR